jgi:hypothetical protein
MRISQTIDNDDEQLGLRLEDVVNDDGEGSVDMGDEHPPVQLSRDSNGASAALAQSNDQTQPDTLPAQDPDSSNAQQLFDHAALEAQITDLLTAEATRPASRAAAAAAAARQRNSNSRASMAADKAKATAGSHSKATADPSSMSFPLSLAAAQSYPLPPPPIGYPPQPSENDSAEPGEAVPGSDQHHTNTSLPADNTGNAASVLDATAGHNPGQPQNFADITDILAHLSAHLESAAAAAAVAAGQPATTQTTIGSSGAEDDDESLHEGREEEEDDDEVARGIPVGERAGGVEEQEDFSRPFVCDVPNCGKGFGRKSDLARHL